MMRIVIEHAGLACALAAAGAALALARAAASRSRRLGDLAAAQEGAAMVEFALAAPVFLGLGLLTVQLALVVIARRAVEGAAFAAARSAVVWVPAAEGEGANRLRRSGASPKRERIERAAALAMLPVVPPEEGPAAGREDPALADALGALARELGIDRPRALLRRYAAARDRLRVGVETPRDAGAAGTGVLLAEPDDPLTVTVTYDCPLNVPVAARLLGVPERETGRFRAPLVARCTMRNEGTPESPLVVGEETR